MTAEASKAKGGWKLSLGVESPRFHARWMKHYTACAGPEVNPLVSANTRTRQQHWLLQLIVVHNN